MADKQHGDLDPKYDNFDYPTVSIIDQTGHPGHTTKEQDAQVHQLRALLEQAGCKDRLDTLTLLRFLRARKFNVEMAKKMFLDCEAWRKDFGTDTLARDFVFSEKEKVFKYYPQFYHKTDKDGRPVYIEQLGNIDLTQMYKDTSEERMLQNLVAEYERFADPRLPACSRKTGGLHETSCTIMDLKGVGVTKFGQVYNYVQKASGISQNYYPERMGKFYLINAPWGFSTVFSVVKGFLDPVTVAKIHVLGGGYKSELLKQVPAENLPEEIGGTCKCPGAGCKFSDAGPWQDKEWYRPAAWEKKGDAIKHDGADVVKDAPAEASGSAPAPPSGAEAEAKDGAAAPAAAS